MPDKKKINALEKLIKDNPSLNSTQLIEKAKNEGFSYRKTDMLTDIRYFKDIPEPTSLSKQKSIPTKYKSAKTVKPIPIEVLKEEAKLGRGLTKKEYSFEISKFGHMVREIQNKYKLSELDAIKRVRSIVKLPSGKRIKEKLSKIDEQILIQFNTP